MDYLKVTQKKSAIGVGIKQSSTLRALGLRKIGDSVEVAERPEIRGMLQRVSHLVSVTPLTPLEDRS